MCIIQLQKNLPATFREPKTQQIHVHFRSKNKSMNIELGLQSTVAWESPHDTMFDSSSIYMLKSMGNLNVRCDTHELIRN